MIAPPPQRQLQLSGHQRSLFKELGFCMLRSHLTSLELRTLAAEGHAAIADAYSLGPAGFEREPGPAMGPSRWSPLMSPSLCPLGSDLLEDPRFHDTVRELFADDPSFFPGDPIGLNAGVMWFSGSTGWHRDVDRVEFAGGVNTGIAFLFYPEYITADSGALRVIPSSQRTLLDNGDGLSLEAGPVQVERLRLDGKVDEEVLSRLCAMPEEQRSTVEVVCETQPGDVIAYATPLFHASFNGGNFRPLFQVNYWAEAPTPALTASRRQESRTIRRNHRAMFNFPDDTHYPYCPQVWIDAGGAGSPRQEWARMHRELAWVEEGSAGILEEEEAAAVAREEWRELEAAEGRRRRDDKGRRRRPNL